MIVNVSQRTRNLIAIVGRVAAILQVDARREAMKTSIVTFAIYRNARETPLRRSE